MREWLKNKYVLIGVAMAVFFSLLILNDSFRSTFSRKQAIRKTQEEMAKIDSEISKMKAKISSLENEPHAHEDLVRRELGYIKPGEKEVRFVQSPSKSR